jgi:hypothetical protein
MHHTKHIEAVKGYFPMTHWRQGQEDFKLPPDRSWIFLVVIGAAMGVLLAGLVLL